MVNEARHKIFIPKQYQVIARPPWSNTFDLLALMVSSANTEATLNYAETNLNMLLNTNILFLERTIEYFISQCLAIVK